MNRVDEERNYWDKAAKDPQVDRKYIADVETIECLNALGSLPGKTLEIGCGVGRLMIDDDCGIDISEEMLKIASKRQPKCEFKLTDGRSIPYPDKTFNSVYSMLVFQHLKPDGVSSYIEEAYRVLKPGGIFRFQYIQGTEREPFSNHYSAEAMEDWLKTAGFTIIKVDKGLVHPQWTWITAKK